MSWSGNDFDFTDVLFEDASFAGATFNGRRVSFAGATFRGANTAFDGVDFTAGETLFGSARFTCLRVSFDSPEEWSNVDFDWDNAPAGSSAVPPRSITPRPWPPYLADEELGSR